MGSALLFIVRSRLLVYSAGVRCEQSDKLFCLDLVIGCFVLSRQKTLCRYGCMYFLAALVLVCVDVIVMSSA